MALKHVGRVAKNKNKVVVAYRTIPGDSSSAVIVNINALSADEHDALMKAVESEAAKAAKAEAAVLEKAVDGNGNGNGNRTISVNSNPIQEKPEEKKSQNPVNFFAPVLLIVLIGFVSVN
jgi:hypothetical protein